IALAEDTRRASADNLNQLLADVITLRDLYKKHHWQTSGPTFYQLHLLFDKHFGEQNELVDLIAERIMMLGGVSVAMSADVAEIPLIPRPPKGREEVPVVPQGGGLFRPGLVVEPGPPAGVADAGLEDTLARPHVGVEAPAVFHEFLLWRSPPVVVAPA